MDLKEYKTLRQPREVETPSGLVLLVKTLSIREMLVATSYPSLLREIALAQIDSNSNSKEEIDRAYKENPASFFELLDQVIIAACGGVITEEETEDDSKISVHLLDQQTKIILFYEILSQATQLSKALVPFRSESGSATASADSKILGEKAKRDGSNTTRGSGSAGPGHSVDVPASERGKEVSGVQEKNHGAK